jgi:hypothetical protein
MSKPVANEKDQPAAIPPSAPVRWLARAMCWLCWLGIAGTAVFGLLSLFDAIPRDWVVNEPRESLLISSSITVEDPASPGDGGVSGLRHDLLYRVMTLVPIAIFVWALLSARRSFIGVGRGEYFSRSTILGLRNFALAVLLHIVVAPIPLMIARGLYVSRFEHGAFMLTFSMNATILLTLVFTGAVALVSTVMARAADIAEENRQFI